MDSLFHRRPETALTSDYRLALIFLVAGLTSVFVGGFAVYRLVTGSYLVAFLNLAAVLTAVGAALFARRTGQVERAGIAVSIMLTVVAVVSTASLGLNGALWVYSVSIFVFYLAPATVGLILVAGMLVSVTIVCVTGTVMVFPEMVNLFGFLASATTTAVFSWFFAHRSAQQRIQLMLWATRDPLTGLENRRALDPELEIAVARCFRHDLICGLVIMDLDNFKEINDTRGHAAGDRVLQSVAQIIDRTTRREDRSFRYGGDEFVVVLPDIHPEGLSAVCAKLVDTIAQKGGSGEVEVRVSAGAAILQAGESPESWNRRADQALYRAKHLGGNRFVLDDGSVPSAVTGS
ncbi:MAG: GGDEF domain-containing protein [Spirochaetaceae bacterium]|nr:MAG: GGDEF domain-containing protein [Spirochaetaceae bacterium]